MRLDRNHDQDLDHDVSDYEEPDNIPDSERRALHDLFESTNGRNWIWKQKSASGHWNFTDFQVNPCVSNDGSSWEGITCDVVNTTQQLQSSTLLHHRLYHISKIKLPSYNLEGSIPTSIEYLSYLLHLDLSSNVLVGSIPLTIANTTRMQQLKLFNNQMRGSLPSGIYNLSQLVNISIANNSFTGPLSNSISRLYNLQYLSISSNKFDGTIPLSIANLSALAYLDIGVNSFVGRIPDSIGNLTQVTTIKLNKNKLSHSIPEAIGNLTQLKYLDLGDNLISKTIPASIVRCSALQRLDVGNNSLTGTLPSFLGSLTKLTYISLRYNYYIGSMPSSYANLVSLTSFRMNNNAITGSLPSFIGDMLSMGYFSFRYNNFSGSIPSSYSRLAAMEVFKVNNNLLTGSIPSFLGSLSNLNYLEVGNNYFVGSIPSSFSRLSLMGLLSLNYNMLTSTIPTFLGYLSYLYVLDLSGNAFEGTIPSILQHLSKLVNFGFARNLLTGTIPDIFASLPLMTGVFLDDNLLSGTIPASLSTLPDLVGCFLENNQLTGPVTSIFNPVIQKSLADIQISNNQLTGALSFGNGEGGDGGFESLSSFSAVTNCFSSADVSMICRNTQLQTLSWDGLSSASSCRHKILPGISSAYKSSYLIGGTLPACLFDMQQLTVLHLSGNGFIGSLPRIVSMSNALTDLSLSYNFLTGSIPSVLQRRSWSKLDLSYNRLSGTLWSFNPPSDDGYTLMLKNNRLSGDIPQAAISFVTISILEGNLFACKTDRSDLPTRDDARSSYECGSDVFNISYYLWLALIGVVLVVASCLYYYRRQDIVSYVDLASIKKHVLRWNNSQHHIDIHNNQQHPTSKERIILMSGYQQYDVIQSLLVKGAIYASAFITVVLLPTYCILRAYFSTHTYEYAWTVSATSLAGKVSFGVLMSLWCSLIILQLVTYKYCLSGFDIVFKVKQPTQVYDSRFIKRWLIYIGYVVFNLMIVAGVNAAYVLVILKSSSSAKVFAQIALSIFKLVWNDGVSPTTVRWILHYISLHGYDHKYSFKRMLFLQLFTALNVNIIIPYLAVMIISTNCFYYALNSRSTINSSFFYQSCQEFTNEQCTTEVQVEAHTSYAPPFVYNYQCSAGIITSYASVYVYVSIFSTFFIPMVKLLLLKAYKSSKANSRLFHATYFFLPNILRPFSREPEETAVVTTTISNGCMETLHQHHRKTAMSGLMDGGSTDDNINPPSPLRMKDNNMSTIKAVVVATATTADVNISSKNTVKRDLLHPYYNANQIVNTNFLTVALILTFGVVFPPLALCLAISSVVRLKFIQLSVGRLIINSIEAHQLSYLHIVDEECDKVVSENLFMNCIFMVLGVCCCFYSMFLFDTLGDTVGFYQSYWVFIVMFVLPACFYGAYRAIQLYQARMMMIHANQQSTDKANIELSSFQSNNPMIEV